MIYGNTEEKEIDISMTAGIRLLSSLEFWDYKTMVPALPGIWWLGSEGLSTGCAMVVCNGRISPTGLPVTERPIMARPVIELGFRADTGMHLHGFGKGWTVLASGIALCDSYVFSGPFGAFSSDWDEDPPIERRLRAWLYKKSGIEPLRPLISSIARNHKAQFR